MTPDRLPDSIRLMMEDSGALLRGHFRLSSGLHSEWYVQCALLLSDPRRAESIARIVGEPLKSLAVDFVVTPAIGGLVFGHELARVLGCRAIWTERDAEGRMALRRGFHVAPGARLVLAEDVITTGKSLGEVLAALGEASHEILAHACVIDRSGGAFQPGTPLHCWARLDIPTYPPDQLPPHLAAVPVVKPGSRPDKSKA